MKFDQEGKFHLYHSEHGADMVTNLTRTNMFFVISNSALLVLEVCSPFFGYWHGISLFSTVLLAMTGSRMLQYYSSRMVNNMWLLKDGKTIEVEFMNAFFLQKTKRYTIRNLGYLEPSRVLNV